ncbi:class I SAM-dependent methyltransferase [Acetobacter persici]|uniref:S-adenosyl-L-methionine (SAM)-dependent methyltransferase PhcB n=1 Tax=Acetobacter persici TaxID=1076596 RepID=A0A6V8I8F2_9PROT|nr:class I SAM-dependent methyltransferase [Acetobacter persici]OUI93859.1 SAM-dependent methyltransferase [Acetobacter persici]GFE93821.1 S-adenosyl-L-methionine (SAM)-dependent methyltransferase PhcB [Acetobacter persici]
MTEPYAAKHYAARAQDYVASTVHSQGSDLDRVEGLVAGQELRRVLDIGCGGGHVTYRLAPHVGEVVACDVTGPMLDAVAQEAARQGLSNITTVQAPAENLPFEHGSFDAVFCRFTTHHWSDALAGLREARRVLAPSGMALFIDVTAPPSALLDSWLQSMELLRDISHVRDYTVAEWTTLLGQVGFVLQSAGTHRLRMDFESWVARTKTPPERVAAIRSLQQAAPDDITRYFGIEADGSFMIDVSSFQVAPL